MRALVVGGTGPTGPYIVNGLLERGFDVAIFHRGTHEIDEIPPAVEHIHGDPHFLETIEESLEGRTFDLAIATYGRIRLLAQALQGKVGRFISVGGVAAYRGYLEPERLCPVGMASPLGEDGALVDDEHEHRFSWLIAQTERAVFEHHPDAAHFRYPYVYGPRQLIPREWSVVRRLRDGRRRIIVADGGLSLMTHGFAGNLAHSVLLAADQPAASAGQIYNCGDAEQYTTAQIIELIARKMNAEVELVNLPHELARSAHVFGDGQTTHHRFMDTQKIRTQLGYRDICSVPDALGLTVEWLLEHAPQAGGDVEQRLQDPFDYAGEDRLIEAWRTASSAAASIPIAEPAERPHPYAHPKKPGERDHRNR
jgi:nucleoside-diphosphate-sugar epimerase